MSSLVTRAARKLRPAYLHWLAFRAAAAPPRPSYAQQGEDRVIMDALGDRHPAGQIYIEIGANHPTRISNTYLFYRHGFSGLIVEPNRSFEKLYRKYRPKDIFLPIGCGEEAALAPFFHNEGSVFSGFSSRAQANAVSSEYLPILPTDSLLALVGSKQVFLLSIDVEGWSLAVLRSGAGILERTTTVLIEHEDEEVKITELLESRGFQLSERSEHNLIFRRVP